MSGCLRVLVVDDDADIRAIVGLALSLDERVEPRMAASAADALVLVAGGLRPDAVVLDVAMPDMDGVQLAAALHRLVPPERLPVIFMTASGRDRDLAALHAAGATGVIVKPFDPLTLAADIRRLAGRP